MIELIVIVLLFVYIFFREIIVSRERGKLLDRIMSKSIQEYKDTNTEYPDEDEDKDETIAIEDSATYFTDTGSQ